jgi:multidrug efflux pump subunit AcrA (membrane-fusion protein)
MERESESHVAPVLVRYLRRRWRVPGRIALGMMAVLLLVAFQPLRPGKQVKEPPRPPFVVAPAEVMSLERSGVGSPFDGMVLAVEVQVGDRVKKGDPLFQMDTTYLERLVQVEKEESAAAREMLQRLREDARRDLSALEQEARFLQAELKRARQAAQHLPSDPRLYGDYPFTPRLTFEQDAARVQIYQLEVGLEEVRAQIRYQREIWNPLIAAARERLTASEREIQRLSSLIGQAERTSPRDGIVTNVKIHPGVSVFAAEPQVQVDDPAGFRVVAQVEQERLDQVPEDAHFGFRLSGDRVLPGKVDKVEEGWDRDLFLHWVWLKPSQTEELMPGDRIDMVIPLSLQKLPTALNAPPTPAG